MSAALPERDLLSVPREHAHSLAWGDEGPGPRLSPRQFAGMAQPAAGRSVADDPYVVIGGYPIPQT